MKIVFENNAEKVKITDIVNNASSISNSQSLIALVRDAEVDGSVAEPKVKEVVSAPNAEQETMADLIKRATGLGVAVTSEDSRAGLLQKIALAKNKKKPADSEEDTEDEEEAEDEGAEAKGDEEEEEEAPKPAKRKTRTSKK